MAYIDATRVPLAVGAFVNSVFINVQANMAAGPRRINMCILLPIANYFKFIPYHYKEVSYDEKVSIQLMNGRIYSFFVVS